MELTSISVNPSMSAPNSFGERPPELHARPDISRLSSSSKSKEDSLRLSYGMVGDLDATATEVRTLAAVRQSVDAVRQSVNRHGRNSAPHVATVFGPGRLICTRQEDRVEEIELSWELANGARAILFAPAPAKSSRSFDV